MLLVARLIKAHGVQLHSECAVLMQVVAEHDSVFQPKSKPEAEVPQEMAAEELEVNAVMSLPLPLPQQLPLPAVSSSD